MEDYCSQPAYACPSPIRPCRPTSRSLSHWPQCTRSGAKKRYNLSPCGCQVLTNEWRIAVCNSHTLAQSVFCHAGPSPGPSATGLSAPGLAPSNGKTPLPVHAMSSQMCGDLGVRTLQTLIEMVFCNAGPTPSPSAAGARVPGPAPSNGMILLLVQTTGLLSYPSLHTPRSILLLVFPRFWLHKAIPNSVGPLSTSISGSAAVHPVSKTTCHIRPISFHLLSHAVFVSSSLVYKSFANKAHIACPFFSTICLK